MNGALTYHIGFDSHESQPYVSYTLLLTCSMIITLSSIHELGELAEVHREYRVPVSANTKLIRCLSHLQVSCPTYYLLI